MVGALALTAVVLVEGLKKFKKVLLLDLLGVPDEGVGKISLLGNTVSRARDIS